MTETAPARNFTAGVACPDETWRPFAPRIKGNSPVPARAFGTPCIRNCADLPAAQSRLDYPA